LAWIYDKLSKKEPLSDRDASDYIKTWEHEKASQQALRFYNYASDCFEKYLELEPNTPNKEQIKNKLYEIDGKRDFAQINRNMYFSDFPRYQVGTRYEAGMIYQGGIIFYVDKSGKHGLIVAAETQGNNVVWSKGNIRVSGTKEKVGSGKDNTDIIVKKLGDGVYAAKLCYDLVLNGYDDWFLPSREELSLLYQNLFDIEVKRLKGDKSNEWKDIYAYYLYGVGYDNDAFYSDYAYWSSSDEHNTYAIARRKTQGGWGRPWYYTPHSPTVVRAVRAF